MPLLHSRQHISAGALQSIVVRRIKASLTTVNLRFRRPEQSQRAIIQLYTQTDLFAFEE